MYDKTRELRRLAGLAGVAATHGYVVAEGGPRVNEDSVTTLWPQPGDASASLTFEEDERGALWCADDMEPAQALAAARVLP